MRVFDLSKYRILIVLIIIILLFGVGIFTFNLALKNIFPLHYETIIEKYSNEYNHDPFLVAAIISVESKFDKSAVSIKGAKGLMQIANITGKWASKELNIEGYDEELLYNPNINIRIGSWYLDKLKKEFNNNILVVLAAYNAGSGNVNKWLKDVKYSQNGVDLTEIPFGETREYIKKVNRNYKIYKYLYED